MISYFKEQQKFTQFLLWLTIISISVIWCYVKYQTYYLKHSFGNIEPTNNLFHFVDIIIGLLFLIFITANLKTEVKEDGIYYKFFPFHFRYKSIKWSNVKKIEVRQYKPLKEYLGWGIRIGASGLAYSVKGNIGLQVILKNNQRILFGTQKPNELRDIIKKIGIDT